MQVTQQAKEDALAPLLRQAFRPMFLFGALFSVLAMALWGLVLSGAVSLNPYANVVFWHQHEMLFGFVAAIIVGFLLTAVQNWTGVRATHGYPLLWLTLIWLAGRLLMLFGGSVPAVLVAVVDLAFLPTAALFFAAILLKAGKLKNMFFVPVLLLLAVCNLLMHLGVLLNQFHFISHGSTNAVWLITLIMAVVSGRVLPMFTANGTQTPRVQPVAWLDKLALGSLWLIFALHFFLLVQYIPSAVMSALFAVAALATLVRLVRVRFWVTLKVPLVWSLHVAVAFIPIGLALFALRYAGMNISASTAIHALTAGAMGIMILSMMARVSLGHSGRPLQPKRLMTLAFMLIIVAASVRVITGGWFPVSALGWYSWAIAAWVLAYGFYIVIYFPILTTPRADGRPG
ncbi:NnrS family protein [Aliidiomarina taiwanensis]|uniref:NnrS family protein n=1 Tax=Aliidiomarina taiwanensis TaxID=946228 RepID=A0A432X870_9GAMM|nr:NnrS family protein [Aliidiomarina taiwanensis]RUO43084.1 NnrS family protein [Aliidiomarina taiwanensis]